MRTLQIVVMGDGGRVEQELARCSVVACPEVGHDVELLDGSVYTVVRVGYVDEGDPDTSGVYMKPRVYVRAKPLPSSSPSSPGWAPAGAEKYLPSFELTDRPAGTKVTASILPPSVVSVFVAVGYLAFAALFDSLAHEQSMGLSRVAGRTWRMHPLATWELQRLAQLAKEHHNAVRRLMKDLTATGTAAIMSPPSAPAGSPPEPADSRTPTLLDLHPPDAPSPGADGSPHPVLRLVPRD
jgi:hypothetical protein